MSDAPIKRDRAVKLDQVLAAHERRARLIAQLHEQAIATANDLSTQQKAGRASVGMPSAERPKPGCFPRAPFF
jgi:hypothetical protein